MRGARTKIASVSSPPASDKRQGRTCAQALLVDEPAPLPGAHNDNFRPVSV